MKEQWSITKEGKYKCNICEKEYTKKGIATHIWRSHGEGKNHNPNKSYKDGSRKTWNKGLKTGPNEKLREGYNSGKIIPSFQGKHHSKETLEKISKSLSKNNHGGKCKWYKVSGIYVQGTWERDLANHMSLLNISWEKIKTNSFTFQYIMDNKIKHYTPDFRIKEFNVLLELKGYWWGEDKRKMELVLEQNDITNLLIIQKEKYKNLLSTISKDEFEKVLYCDLDNKIVN